MRKLLPIVLIATLLFTGCAEVLITGRKQFSLVSPSQLITLSQDTYRKIINESKLSQDPQEIQRVKEVGERMAFAAEQFMRQKGRASQINSYRWEFNLIEDEKVANAFCMSGGKIAVYTGLLPISQDDAGLATVLGHEIAHAITNHAGERMSHILLVQLGGVALYQALERSPKKTRQWLMIVYGIGANVGVLLPYSRVHEREADRIGLILMALAGYDPHKAIDFWERMKEQGGPRPPQLLSTHPVPEKRLEDIRRCIPEAMKYYKK